MRAFCFLLAFVVAAAAVRAESTATAPTTPPGSDEDLHGIRVALERIVVLLEARGRADQLETYYRRIELSFQENAPLHQELNSLRSMLRFTEPDLAESQSALEKALADREAGAPLPGDETAADQDTRIRKLQEDISLRTRSLTMARKRISELESLVAAADQERAQWKRFLDQELARQTR